MTDQLEHDLRTLLTQRADSVTADPAAGEQTIADRLRTGDDAVAAVIPMPDRRPRRRWLPAVAAAAAVVVAVIAVVVTSDDSSVSTGPSEQPVLGEDGFFVGRGTAEDVARAYLLDRLLVNGSALQLETLPHDTETEGFSWTRTDTAEATGGVVALDPVDDGWIVISAESNYEDPAIDVDGPSIDRAERDADSVTITTTAPAGTYVQLSVHELDGGALTAGGCGGESSGGPPVEAAEPVACDLIDEPIEAGDEPLTVRFSVVTQEGVVLTLEEQLLLVSPDPALP